MDRLIEHCDGPCVVCIGMFANPILLLDKSRAQHTDEAPIHEEVMGLPFLDAFLRTYLVGLGDFQMETFGDADQYLVWIFFILSTLIL